jgi:hypothetical protein
VVISFYSGKIYANKAARTISHFPYQWGGSGRVIFPHFPDYSPFKSTVSPKIPLKTGWHNICFKKGSRGIYDATIRYINIL